MLQQAATSNVKDPDDPELSLKEKLLRLEREDPQKFLKILTDFCQECLCHTCMY